MGGAGELFSCANVSNGKILIKYPDEFGPDGITVDKHGNLYVALRGETNPGIYIYNPSAELIDKIPLSEVPSNVTFGKGKDKNCLFITAGGSLYKMNVLSEGINLKRYGKKNQTWNNRNWACSKNFTFAGIK